MVTLARLAEMRRMPQDKLSLSILAVSLRGHLPIVASSVPIYTRRIGRVGLVTLALVCAASAQYREYSQIAGKTQAVGIRSLPAKLSFDLEIRERGEGQTATTFTSGNDNGYDLTRIRGGVDLAPARWLNVYVQFHDTHALNLPLAFTAANMRDTFDFRQAYVRLHRANVEIIGGRQELRFGGERLIGISDWTNVSRTFDAVSAKVGGKNSVTFFTASVVVIHPTALDMHTGGLNFHGAYGSITTWVRHTTIEPYLFVKRLPRVLSQQSIYGTENEVVPGVRVLSNLPGHVDVAVEGVLERGSFSNDSIHAWAGNARVGYTAPVRWTPRLQGEYDYATGNSQTNPQRVSTFDQLYPSAHNVFGLVDFFGWQNIRQLRFNFELNPTPHLSFLLQQEFLTAADKNDSVYTGSGSVLIKHPTGGFVSDHIGTGFDLSSKYVIHDNLVLNTGVGHFFPGELMTANKHGAAATIAYASLTYRIRASKAGRPK